MKKHLLFRYKTQKFKMKKEDTTMLTFTTEDSDRDDFVSKADTTTLTETVETSDEDKCC